MRRLCVSGLLWRAAVDLLLTARAVLTQADILMVTDGEIAPPKQELLDDIARANEEMGLEVHGLIVSSQLSESMQKLCTHLHVFKSWSKVGAESWQY